MLKKHLFVIPTFVFSPRLRFFCFPYAGGTASAYIPWIGHLPKNVEIALVQPLGRATIFGEAAHEDMDFLSSGSVVEQNSISNRQHEFFGHSLGSNVVFEVVKVLQSRKFPAPLHFVAPGSRAPHLFQEVKTIQTLPEAALVSELKHLNGTLEEVQLNKASIRLMLPYLRAHFRISELHVAKLQRLASPLMVFYGNKVNAWPRLLKFTKKIFLINCGHSFINEAICQVFTWLTGLLASASQGAENKIAVTT